MVVNDFLDSYPDLKSYSSTCDFVDETNPADGVCYPDICKDVPDNIRDEILCRLGDIVCHEPENPIIFLRMSKSGVNCPHIFHNDISMGKYSFMLYLNTREDSGTALAIHKSTGQYKTPCDIDDIIDDMNNQESWEIYKKADMVENRGVLFDSSLFHCALPIGGFGDKQEDARIVLTCFFS